MLTTGSRVVLYICALAALNYGLIAMKTSHLGAMITDSTTKQVVYAIIGLSGLFMLLGLLSYGPKPSVKKQRLYR